MSLAQKSTNKILNKAVENHLSGNFLAAENQYRKFLRLEPKNAHAIQLFGLLFGQNEHYEKALELFSLAISLEPDYSASYSNRALIFKKMGNFHQALEDCARALAINPNCTETLNNRGAILIDLDMLDQALETLKKSIRINPNSPSTIYNMAIVLKKQKHYQVAIKAFDTALKLNPSYFEALLLRGEAFCEIGKFEEALEDCKEAIKLNPENSLGYYNQGYAFFNLARFKEALNSFNKSIKLNSESASAYNNRGLAFIELGDLNNAITDFKKSIDLKPTNSDFYLNLGNALYQNKNSEQALKELANALQQNPKDHRIFINMSAASKSLGDFEASVDYIDKAISLKPNNAEALFSKSLLLLQLGDYLNGWELYEWRWKTKKFTSPKRTFNKYAWNGEQKISGKTILIHWEQGLGDTIHFSRLIGEVLKKGASVIFEVQKPLYSLMKNFHPNIQVIDASSALPYFDFYCPLLSLPHNLNLTLKNLPLFESYIKSDPLKKKAWTKIIGRKNKSQFGICWSGSTTHKNDGNRSIRLIDFLEAFPKNHTLISLQKEVRAEDLPTLQNNQNIQDYSQKIDDFSDTAAICDLMDIVVTVDTSIAHLAGAMGKPVFLLLPTSTDFRWLLNREDTPWYPSMRIFRQKTPGDWKPVFSKIKRILEELNENSN